MIAEAFAGLPGAVRADGGLAHFGDPIREQRRLADGDALVPLAELTIVEVAGPQRRTWLDSITSQELTGLGAGDSTELLVLDPQGRIEHVAGVIDDGTALWLIVDADTSDALVAWLRRMLFRTQATVEPRPELGAVGWFAAGAAEATARPQVHAPNAVPLIWEDPWPSVSAGGHQYAEVADHPGESYAWRVSVVTAEAADALAATATVSGSLAAEALRIAAWRPRWRTEVDERSLPHESDWLRTAVHLGKGCYRGQETVAKVHNLGHPPRRLAALHLDGSDDVLPERGAAVFAGEDEVGTVTSAARHYQDGPIALALLSRRAPLGDLVVRAEGGNVAAAQQVIVPADAGATAAVPRLTRLSRRPTAEDPRARRSE